VIECWAVTAATRDKVWIRRDFSSVCQRVTTENIAIDRRRCFYIALLNVKTRQKIRYADPMEANVKRDRDHSAQGRDVIGVDESRR
jgi:hypothetical protein